MKTCPKCGKENDDSSIFCEACDWKLNLSYAKNGDAKYLMNSRMFAIGSIALGVISIVSIFMGVGLFGAIMGGLGMFLGGYTQSFVRVAGVKDDKRKILVIISVVGLILSVIGFMFGFSSLF